MWQTDNSFYSGQFTQNEPSNGEKSAQKTDIYFAYDDFSIYIAAKMYDNPDSILQEFGIRDSGERNSDMFALGLDTYNKQQNAFFFMVSAAGVQTDIFITPDNEDANWNSVWKSEVKIVDDGWIVEMEIPYSAIRFPKQEVQNWGVNFMRVVRRKREKSFWNPVDASVNGFVNQFGQLTGLQGIEPPLRLQLFPYISGYVLKNGSDISTSINGGMDLKYGINESFTLDMTLVPDFGQVVSDNLILNLSPFEVQFSENRQFFTEGTELFNKGGLFYSRRVGQSFANFNDVYNRFIYENNISDAEKSNYEITNMPDGGAPNSAPLVNATKISGRTKKGVGIGIFNAVTKATEATITNSETGETHIVQADPLTNFNVLVFDKNLKNNSNIGIINTSVIRGDGGRDANVTGTDFRFNDKENKFGVRGFGAITQRFHNIQSFQNKENYNYDYEIQKEGGKLKLLDIGHKYFLEVGKYSGKWQYRLSRNVESDDYNPRDLGFLRAPNEISHRGQISYNIFKPKSIFLRYSVSGGFWHEQLYEPNKFSNKGLFLNMDGRFKNFWSFGAWSDWNVGKSYDYFSPRTDDFSVAFIREASTGAGFWTTTDTRKKVSINFYAGAWTRPVWNQVDNWFGITPRVRVNNKLSLNHSFEFTKIRNELGYVNNNNDIPTQFNPNEEIPFGKRGIVRLENTFNTSYVFNNKMGVNLRVRHFWTKVDYNEEFFFLSDAGKLEANPYNYNGENQDGESIHDINYNAFNVDLNLNWQIAPGSFVTVNYKVVQELDDRIVDKSYGKNFSNVINGLDNQSFSVRVLYFLDYIDVKKAVSRKKG